MNIEEILLPEPHKRHSEGRCSKLVRSCGSISMSPRHNTCRKLATFKMDGTPYCAQHAGETALKHLIGKAAGEA
jgi:hypothetical protein